MIKAFNASISDRDCSTVVLYSPFFASVYFGKPGDLSWESLRLKFCPNSVLSFNDQWYFTDYKNVLQKFEPDLKSVKPLTPLKIQDGGQHDKYYLVKYNSQMFLLHMKVPINETFDIFRVDLEANRLIRINNIRDLAFFVGCRGRFLVLSSKDLPSIKHNSIYFCTGELTSPIGVYDLADRENKSFSTGSVHDGVKRIGSSIRPFTLVDHLAAYGSPLCW